MLQKLPYNLLGIQAEHIISPSESLLFCIAFVEILEGGETGVVGM